MMRECALKPVMTLDELGARDLPATLPFASAAATLGFGRTAAYAAKREGRFPVPVIELGHRWVVPTAPLLELLGLSNAGQPQSDSGAAQHDGGDADPAA
jgi:hypothetical protein